LRCPALPSIPPGIGPGTGGLAGAEDSPRQRDDIHGTDLLNGVGHELEEEEERI